METFDFKFWTVRTGTYPDMGGVIKMGRGITVGVKPLLPIQRNWIITFSSLRWFADNNGAWVSSIEPTQNILKFTEFYEAHLNWKKFIFPHPVYGNVNVRFLSQFSPPPAMKGGSGWTESFEITVEETFI